MGRTMELMVALACLLTMITGCNDDPPRTRTWNLRLRRPTPYPLGQRAMRITKRNIRGWTNAGRLLGLTLKHANYTCEYAAGGHVLVWPNG